jgi:hypothetical protein
VLLQSDAVVTGGQSGGAFVDGVGRVIGMSDMAIGANASFSVASTDIIEAIDRIRDGTSVSAPRLPQEGDGEAGTTALDIADSDSTGRVIIPPSPTAREVSIAYDGVDDDDGTYVFWLPAGDYAVLELTRGRAGTLEVDIDVPFVEVAPFAEGAELEVGDEIDGVLGRFPSATLHEIELVRGDKVDIRLATPGLLAVFDLLSPSDTVTDYTFGDFFAPYGVEFGWGDQVSDGSFEILRGGTYRILVQGESSMAYHLSVKRAAD